MVRVGRRPRAGPLFSDGAVVAGLRGAGAQTLAGLAYLSVSRLRRYGQSMAETVLSLSNTKVGLGVRHAAADR
jgi:hypothetical protein